MALFIRDSDVDALAEELRRLTHAKTKTEAVRDALQARLDEIDGPPRCATVWRAPRQWPLDWGRAMPIST